MVRGTLLESIPDDHATVLLATGQTAIIPWERVQHIDRAGANAPKSASAVTAWVHVESDRPVRIERRSGERSRDWDSVCTSPCDTELPLDAEYRIAGEGVRNSAPFQLSARAGERVELAVNTASKGGFVGGIVLTSLGPVTSLIGAVVLVAVNQSEQIAAEQASFGGTPSTTTTQNNAGAKTVGVVLIIGGIAMTIGGILMLTGNAHTHLDQGPIGTAPRSQDAWLRTPTWRDDRMGEALPKTYDAPLFHTTF